MVQHRSVDTPQGEAHLAIYRARAPSVTVVLTHGAGGGIQAPDLQHLARALPREQASVLLVEMPWRVAGKRMAPRPEVIDESFRAVLDRLRVRTPLVVGGRSAGARSACRIARDAAASGVLALSFPLHPPGQPERSRVAELRGVRVPTLVVQGGRDPFGTPEEFPAETELVVVPDADHSLKVPVRAPLSAAEGLAIVEEAALEWLVREVGGA